MILSIDLTPDEERRLRTQAQREGVDTAEYAKRLLTEHLPPLAEESSVPPGGSLADLLGDYIGSVQGSGEANSERCGERFTEHLIKKRREGHL